ncbi:unnamed protein product [Plutella xylostella]|nr:unnamed protein product [Plutella xylostella]
MSPREAQCIQQCPVTSEFNPVCGSDGQEYSNPGRLDCARGCGRGVTLARSGPCPRIPVTDAPAG